MADDWYVDHLPGFNGLIELGPGVQIPGSRYRIIRRLGDGGMGEVFEAEHIDIERRVAIKVLRAEACSTPRITQLFREEARAANRIGVENIAEVYDFAELPDGRLMFAMELLSGPTLAEALVAGRMGPSRVIGIARQICKALAAAHQASIIHRDIKPENVVLETIHGREDTVKLVDFGSAIMMEDASQPQPVIVGTPHYLAPEAILGRPYDGRLDIYAVGCTAYEMLTGVRPFDADDVKTVFQAQVQQVPLPPSRWCPDTGIPEELEWVIMKCMAKNPADRFASMGDLEAAFCEAQLASELVTSWDDLPLPDVESYRLEYLRQSLPRVRKHGSGARSRQLSMRRHWGWLIAATVGAGFVGFSGLGAWPASDLGSAADRGLVAQTVDTGRSVAAKELEELQALERREERDSFRAADREHDDLSKSLAVSVGSKDDSTSEGRGLRQQDQTQPQNAEQASEVRRRNGKRRKATKQKASPTESSAQKTPAQAVAETTPLPEVARELTNQARSALRRGQTRRAEALFEKALAADHRNIAALLGVSDLHFDQGRYVKAAAYAEQAVRVAPDNAPARIRLGDAYFKVLRYEDALRQYERAATLGYAGAEFRIERARSNLAG